MSAKTSLQTNRRVRKEVIEVDVESEGSVFIGPFFTSNQIAIRREEKAIKKVAKIELKIILSFIIVAAHYSKIPFYQQ